MISQQTAGELWNCYREIEVAKKLLADLEQSADEFRDDVRRETVKDAFGRHKRLTLGVPSGDNSQRLLDVSPRLAVAVINSHIAEKHRQLAELQEVATLEISGQLTRKESKC
jgi:hypothetical protein